MTKLDQLLSDLHTIETTYDVFRFLRRSANSFGFEQFSLVGVKPNEDQLASLMVLNNWEPELINAYDKFEFAKESPILKKIKKSQACFQWDIRSLNSHREKPVRTKVIDLFTDFKLTEGFYVPIHQRNGSVHAIGFGGEKTNLSTQAYAELHFLSYFAFEKLKDLTGEVEHSRSNLSQRESDCLNWTANGKTSGEIGAILSISIHTVNNHLASCVEKLDVMNRTQAVAVAMRKGFLN